MFKNLTEENRNIYEFVSNKRYNLDQSSLTRYQFLSESVNVTSASYYDFARINFYLSGSDLSRGEKKYNSYPIPGNLLNQDNTHFNKFHDSGSIVFIPQSQFGDKIKRGTFTLTDSSTSTDIKIIDDLNGNLYAPSATFSQSANSSLSSSDNYVGNIFYDIGAFTITETASYDGTNNYNDVTSGNFTINYQGVHEISTYEYVCNAAPNEFNQTQNESIFKPNTGGKLKNNLTGSFPTFITEVGLYDDDKNLMGIAKVSQAIPKSRKIPMRFFVRMDY